MGVNSSEVKRECKKLSILIFNDFLKIAIFGVGFLNKTYCKLVLAITLRNRGLFEFCFRFWLKRGEVYPSGAFAVGGTLLVGGETEKT